MTDAPAPEETPPAQSPDAPPDAPPSDTPEVPDEVWQIEVDHGQYYRWLPIREQDVTEGMVTIEATWPGFKMYRETINEPTTSTTAVNVPSLKEINVDREAAGLARKTHAQNLLRHLEDGPWPKHFPLESITAVRCSNPDIQAKLTSHFVAGAE